MILITGGAYQGKSEFLMQHWNIAPEEICDMAQADESAVGNEPAEGIRAVVHYQEAVRVQLKQGKDPAAEPWLRDCGHGNRRHRQGMRAQRRTVHVHQVHQRYL